MVYSIWRSPECRGPSIPGHTFIRYTIPGPDSKNNSYLSSKCQCQAQLMPGSPPNTTGEGHDSREGKKRIKKKDQGFYLKNILLERRLVKL